MRSTDWVQILGRRLPGEWGLAWPGRCSRCDGRAAAGCMMCAELRSARLERATLYMHMLACELACLASVFPLVCAAQLACTDLCGRESDPLISRTSHQRDLCWAPVRAGRPLPCPGVRAACLQSLCLWTSADRASCNMSRDPTVFPTPRGRWRCRSPCRRSSTEL